MADDDEEGGGGMMMQARRRPVLVGVVAFAGTMASIVGGVQALQFLHIDPIPWASADDIKGVADTIKGVEDRALKRDEQILKRLDDMASGQNALLREFWEKRREEALEELAANPGSRTARAQKIEANRQIAKIDQQERGVAPHAVLPPED